MCRQAEWAGFIKLPQNTYENSEKVVMKGGMFIITIIMLGIMGTARADI